MGFRKVKLENGTGEIARPKLRPPAICGKDKRPHVQSQHMGHPAPWRIYAVICFLALYLGKSTKFGTLG